MTRIHPFAPSLLVVLLTPACGDDSIGTSGFTGATEAVTTTSGDPSTGADTGLAPTTGDAPTGDVSSTVSEPHPRLHSAG